MENENQVVAMCILGHGRCPKECPLHELAKKITRDLAEVARGSYLTGQNMRRVVYANPNTDPSKIAKIEQECLKNKK